MARRVGDVYLLGSGTRAAAPSTLAGHEWLAVAEVVRASGASAAGTGAVIRSGADDAGLVDAIRLAVDAKPKGHDFRIARAAAPAVARHMSTTGG